MTIVTRTTKESLVKNEAATWTIADAKARFAELVDRAVADGPQVVTRRGRQTAVVVSVDEWERKTRRRGTLADFLAASPLVGSGLTVERMTDGPRDVDL